MRARPILLTAALLAGVIATRPAPAEHVHGGPDAFVTVSDGTSIAVSIVFPDSFDPANPGAKKYPTIYEMAGYENGSSSDEGRTFFGETEDHCNEMFNGNCPPFPLPGDSHEGTSAFRYDDDYVSVHAQLRGTGCSSGEFNLYSTRSALDGVEVIENWLVKQPWSNGKVGILGHSYSGATGFMIAAMYNSPQWGPGKPQHLVAMTVSGMIDDLYRGITYPGGVSNYLFPPLWALAIRNAYDIAGGSAQALVRHFPDEIAQRCLQNMATHRRTVVEDPVLNGINDVDGEWWHARSNIYIADQIDVPFHLTGAFQDEQTGDRFAHLWEGVRGVPKRMLMLNGDHGSQVGPDEAWKDRKAWMDYWMRGVPNPYVNPAQRPVSVRTLFEMHDSENGIVSSGFKESNGFPLPDTNWTPYFLGVDGVLSPAQTEPGTAMYVSGTKRQSWFYDAGPEVGPPVTTTQGPDQLDFVTAPFATDTAMAGPITANLFLDSTAPDTDIFVQVTDRDAEGNVSWLTRGVLKASHRAINYDASDYNAGPDPLDPSKPFLYRPWRPHTNPQQITPLEVNEYLIEIWPVAHIFRAGHSLQIKIMAPSAVDSYYSYAIRGMPLALNTVHFGGDTPSRVTIPIVGLPAGVGPPIPCGGMHMVRCFPD
jgi:putative CocE/NonD family hydrolase